MEFRSLLVVLSIALVYLYLWLVLWNAATIGGILGPIRLNIISRLIGLILLAIVVEIITSALKQLFPAIADQKHVLPVPTIA